MLEEFSPLRGRGCVDETVLPQCAGQALAGVFLRAIDANITGHGTSVLHWLCIMIVLSKLGGGRPSCEGSTTTEWRNIRDGFSREHCQICDSYGISTGACCPYVGIVNLQW